MTTITLEHVTKRFKGGFRDVEETQAVDDVSLRVRSGDSLVLIGPSGSGKSTLLRLVAGTVRPSAGRVLYDDHDIESVPHSERGVGMVFQNKAFYPHWKARKSVGFFLTLRQHDHELPARIEEISRITGFELDMLLERRPAQLSGGEQQRVAIARALARDLKILLLDDPFADLDIQSRLEARVELGKLLHEVSITTIYVTHRQEEAQVLGERVAVMREGRIEQIGTYQQLYDMPVNLFVGRFVGLQSMNCFEGEVQRGQWWGQTFGGFAIRGDLPDGMAVTLGVRPEHINPSREGVPGRVTHVMTHLSDGYRVVEVAGQHEEWTLTAPLEVDVERGDMIASRIDPAGVFYFDTATEARIG